LNFLIIAGIVLLVLTYWDYQKDETDTIFILEWWIWFDVSRESLPLLYWAILLIQFCAGIVLIFQGLFNS